METGLYLNLSRAPHWWHVKRLFPSMATPAERDDGIMDVDADVGGGGGATLCTMGVSCSGSCCWDAMAMWG